MYKAFLIKYAEIAIKGKRGHFPGGQGDGAYFRISPGRI